MTNPQTILEKAITLEAKKPTPDQVNQALLTLEKNAKKPRENYQFEQLLHSWQLWFITGTKKAKQRAGIILGQGFYLPSFVKVTLSYSPNQNQENSADYVAGIMKNSVKLGLITLTLTGGAKFIPKKNILAFDFTRINLDFLGKTIYQGSIRGGEIQEAKFYQESIKYQPFFHYFYISDTLICARGKGGGLALWKKI